MTLLISGLFIVDCLVSDVFEGDSSILEVTYISGHMFDMSICHVQQAGLGDWFCGGV